MFRRCLLTLGLVFALGTFAAHDVATAADPLFCNNYANEAAHSVQLAAKFKCGFHGPRWTKGAGPHMAWCLIAKQNDAQFESEARAAELKPCTCQWYADHTMVQVATNIAEKCGFTGLRWLDNKKAHYDWCFNVNPGINAMQSEMDIRKNMLKGC